MSDFTLSATDIQNLEDDYNALVAADGPLSQDTNFDVGSTIYADILAEISVDTIVGYLDNGDPIYTLAPAQGVDPAVWDWIDGAQYVNQDDGFFGQFIVDYTADQYDIREGQQLSTSLVAQTSNSIAYAVYSQITQNFNEGIFTLPSIQTIEDDDAGAAAAVVFNSIYNNEPDVAGWAGSLLFPFLGASDIFDNVLISTNSISNGDLSKHSTGMYDLITALEAQGQALISAGISSPLSFFEQITDPPYTNVPGYQTAASAAVNAANSAFATYYNLPSSNIFMPGDDLVLNQSLPSGTAYIAGTATQGELIPTSGIVPLQNAVIVGGSGNNTVVAPSSGNDLIDGGNGGHNTLDLSDVEGNLTITSIYNPSGPQEMIITAKTGGIHPNDRTIYAYSFSTLILNSGDDTVTFSESDVPGLQTLITGGGNDVVDSSVDNLSIDFGDGANDTLIHAGPGSVVESGTGSDTFSISNDVLITGATPQDRIAFNASDVYGALAWNSAQGGWAYNNYSYGVGYGLNQNGDLVVKTPGADPQYMYIANYVGGPGIPQNESTADIYLAVVSEHAYRLIDPHPSVDFVWSQFNLANEIYKIQKGSSYWPGADPLVLALNGNSLDLIGESEVSPMYDIYNDSFAVHTGWVKPDDGLLVWDDNGTDELLGSNGSSGFAALAAAAGINLDSLTGGDSADATIDSSDSIFSQLYVWQDLNGNGVMDPGELESLSQAGIASISLNATAQTASVAWVWQSGTHRFFRHK